MKTLLTIFLAFSTLTIMNPEKEHKKAIKAFQKELNKNYLDPEKSPLNEKQRKVFKKNKGHNFFPIDMQFKVEAKFLRTPNDAPFKMKTTTNRLPDYVKYGEAQFELAGKTLKLNIYQSVEIHEGYEDYLFLPFTDLSSGETTYGGGRYLDLTIPKEEKLILDFNKAYAPYCAYSSRFSCPIPPRENFMDTEIKAGVKNIDLK